MMTVELPKLEPIHAILAMHVAANRGKALWQSKNLNIENFGRWMI